ncbi:hypothetical protein R1flu_023333 [Riccia fluitans]|uniref:Uncharacterized protein n=1 Tax=Riccia fluitans TaxID=41844 RepID=A0ABD1XUQ6_9MARC
MLQSVEVRDVDNILFGIDTPARNTDSGADLDRVRDALLNAGFGVGMMNTSNNDSVVHALAARNSPRLQQRKSGNFSTKNVVHLPELGMKPLLPPNYRSPAAMAVADLETVMFHVGEAGVGGMLGDWAAVMIQSFWCGYAARKTKALLALVRLQALACGYLVRKKFRPLVNTRIQVARARSKLSRNSKVQLLATLNGYGIA